jgi:flagellar biosynthesis GTPase FlhF
MNTLSAALRSHYAELQQKHEALRALIRQHRAMLKKLGSDDYIGKEVTLPIHKLPDLFTPRSRSIKTVNTVSNATNPAVEKLLQELVKRVESLEGHKNAEAKQKAASEAKQKAASEAKQKQDEQNKKNEEKQKKDHQNKSEQEQKKKQQQDEQEKKKKDEEAKKGEGKAEQERKNKLRNMEQQLKAKKKKDEDDLPGVFASMIPIPSK